MATFEVNEKSSFDLDVELRDSNGNPLSPIDKVEWWVGQPRNETPVIEKTEVTSPAADMTITIPKEANICSGRRDEGRFVIVRAESGAHVKYEQYDYTVLNLGLVPYPED